MGNSPPNPQISGTECYSNIFGPSPGKFLETTHGKTHYILEGPPNADCLVVLQHGLGSDAVRLQGIAESLVETGRYQVLRYDFYDRGYSESDPAKYPIEYIGSHPLDFTMEVYAEQMRDVLTGLGLDKKPLVQCGHSMGALTGIAYASIYPEQMEGMVLMDAVCLPAVKPLIAKIAELPVLGTFLAQRFGASAMVKFSKASVVDPEHEVIAPFLEKQEQNTRNNPRFFASIRSTNGNCKGMVGSAESEFRKCCQKKYPIRFIWGKADTATPYTNCLRMQEIAEEEGCATTELSFDGIPHNVYFEDAKMMECAESIKEFLDGLPK